MCLLFCRWNDIVRNNAVCAIKGGFLMDNITESMMLKLKSVGFCYPNYEHFLNTGMVYSYQGSEYCIGGWEDCQFTDTDHLVAKEGLWLPDGAQLLNWLQDNDFSISVHMDSDEHYWHVCVTDSVSGMEYTAGGIPITYALYKVIYKICKSNQRDFTPKSSLRIEIQNYSSVEEE
jgi:hypothetical protein